MGDIADGMINGEFDYITGEYLGRATGYPRTYTKNYRKENYPDPKVKAIRKELAILIQEKQSYCTTKAEKNKAVTDARAEINVKYGKGWRNN